MDSQYGPLSAQFYQITKPIDADYPDVPYYLELLHDVKGRILEIGAGTGRLVVPLLEEGLNVEALEPSPHMLEWLNKNLKDRKLKCPIHRVAAEDFQSANSFAAILISFGSFQLFAPRQQAQECLQRCYKNLSKNGRLFIDLDVIRPEPHKAGLMSYGTRVDSGKMESILLQGSRRWDFVEPTELVHLRYEKWKSAKLISTEVQDFTLRSYSQWELLAMLKDAGFKTVDVTADYGNPELHPDASTLCFIAQK